MKEFSFINNLKDSIKATENNDDTKNNIHCSSFHIVIPYYRRDNYDGCK